VGLGVDPGLKFTGMAALAWDPSLGAWSCGGAKISVAAKDTSKTRLRAAADDTRRIREHYETICAAIEQVKPCVIGVEAYTIYDTKEYEHLRDVASGLVGFLGLKKGAKAAAAGGGVFDSASSFVTALHNGQWTDFLNHIGRLAEAVDAFRFVRGRGDAAKTYGVYTAVMCAAFRYGLPIYEFYPVELKKAATGVGRGSKDDVATGLSARIPNLQAEIEAISAASLRNHAYDAAGHAMMALLEYHRLFGTKTTENPQ
jgi:Holliday junction resolvasome RuvABC endonuclease subunit